MTTDSEFNVPLIIRGEIIDDYEVSFAGRNGGVAFRTPDVSKYMNRLTKGDAAALAAYQDVKVEEIARFLNELSGMLNLDKNSAWKRAYELSVHTSGLTAPILEFLYTYGARKALSRDAVMEYAEKRIGIAYLEGWVEQPLANGGVNAIRAFGSKAVNIIAGNLPGVSVNTVLRGAITRSDCITKTPSNDPLTMSAILRTMIELDRDHPVTRHMSAAYWKGGDEKVEATLYNPNRIEKIVAWGGFDSIKHITRYLQPGLDLITLDPKHSMSVIGREALVEGSAMEEAAIRAALDVGLWNQEACANARMVYVECDVDDPEQLEGLNRLGQKVFEGFAKLPTTLSTPVKSLPQELKEELEGLVFQDEWYRLHRGGDRDGCVIVSQTDEAVPFASLLAARTVNLVPVASADEALKRVSAWTQTIGVYPPSLRRKIRDGLALRGAQMIVDLGFVARMNSYGPMDGMEPERRMLKWVVDQTPSPRIPAPWTAESAETQAVKELSLAS